MVQRGQSPSKEVLSRKLAGFWALSGPEDIGTVFSGRATHWCIVRRLAFSVREKERHNRPVRTGNTGHAARNRAGIGRRVCARIRAPGRAAGAGATPHTNIVYRG